MNTQILPVSLQTNHVKEGPKDIYFPQVIHLKDKHVERKINQAIVHLLHSLINWQKEQQGTNEFTEIIGQYEIKTNERHILSLNLINYAYAEGFAHGLTVIKSLTFDTTTGETYELSDLFAPNSDYIKVLSHKVAEQIKERDIPLLNTFTHIQPNQDFYLADKALVLYFQLYEITPYYIGLPMFPVSIYDLEGIAKKDGLLTRLMAN